MFLRKYEWKRADPTLALPRYSHVVSLSLLYFTSNNIQQFVCSVTYKRNDAIRRGRCHHNLDTLCAFHTTCKRGIEFLEIPPLHKNHLQFFFGINPFCLTPYRSWWLPASSRTFPVQECSRSVARQQHTSPWPFCLGLLRFYIQYRYMRRTRYAITGIIYVRTCTQITYTLV